MKSLGQLAELLLVDAGRKCAVPIGRDIMTMKRRVKDEGDSFITITLPLFCRDFDRSLAERQLVPGSFLHFKKCNKSGMPAFMQGFLYQVFDRSGQLLKQPSIDCIQAIRQVCLAGKKILRSCSEKRQQDAMDAYMRCDDDVVSQLPQPFANTFRQVGRILFRSLGLSVGSVLYRAVPAHGPGATEEKLVGNAKWLFPKWHRRLEEAGISFYLSAWPFWETQIDTSGGGSPWPDIVNPEDEAPVRVVFVPKTQKTPRVIAVEPSCMQFAQQGLLKVLVGAIETSPLTSGHVNFTSQKVNQDLALNSSRDGALATLDMSEASDRVSVVHVEAIFGGEEGIYPLLFATRSQRAQLPDGRVLCLKKFASMGSALCFPVEAMVFFTTIIASRIRSKKLPVNEHTVFSQSRDVYVYGDDIIVPTDEAAAISVDLDAFGFKVNRHKSFWTGQFRESCGVDAFAGEKVTPVYLRRDMPLDRGDAHGIVSAVSTGNQLFQAGYYSTAMAIRKAVERLTGSLPEVPADSPAIGWFWPGEARPRRRWLKDGLQRWEYYLLVPSPPKDPDPLEGWSALAKCYRLIGSKSVNPKHLERSPRRYGLTLKRRWVPLG